MAGVFYVVFLIFWLVGFSNAVNLTDGLDGLVSGTASIAFAAFGVIALFNGQTDVALFAFAVTGALLGFLIFNANPAKVFMGDTGSLALGGALAMLSVLTKSELLLLLVGLVFVIETLSVILQVGSFKLRKKRIFKMSPIHHHFELTGWSEWKVVIIFWSTGLIVALIAVLAEDEFFDTDVSFSMLFSFSGFRYFVSVRGCGRAPRKGGSVGRRVIVKLP